MSITSILLAILVFSILIIVHEFGHFLLAKKNGIGVTEFTLGLGPKIVGFTRNNTLYCIKAIPFGGSCVMVGEDDEDASENSYNSKSPWARLSVIVAGPVFNFLLAFVLAVIVIGFVGIDKPVLSGVMEGYPAEEAGMQAGDVITKLNDKNIVIYRDIQLYLMVHSAEPLEVTYERDGEEFKTTIVPQYSEESGSYLMGIQGGVREQVSAVDTLKYSAYEVKYLGSSTFTSLKQLVTGKVARTDISGAVGIVNLVGEMVEQTKPDGAFYVFINLANFSIMLSMSLGVFNLLPIPALDGGRILFIIIELIRGKPVAKEKEGMVHLVGMALLMLLMVVILFNDIINILN